MSRIFLTGFNAEKSAPESPLDLTYDLLIQGIFNKTHPILLIYGQDGILIITLCGGQAQDSAHFIIHWIGENLRRCAALTEFS